MPPIKRRKKTRWESEEIVAGGVYWQDHFYNIQSRNSYALRKKKFCDVKFVVGPEQVEFSCHRLILALGSPVFEAMFYGALADTNSTIVIPDLEPEGFQHLVSFLYSNEVGFSNDGGAFQTYFAADKYCVPELVRQCDEFLCSCKLFPSNVWSYFEYSLLLNSKNIQKHCLNFLMTDAKSSMEGIHFLTLSPTAIKTLLSSEYLDIHEVDLIERITGWAEFHTEGEEVESFVTTLAPLLQQMHFSSLEPHEFLTLWARTRLSEVVSHQDAVDILQHAIFPKCSALPEWCCYKIQRQIKCLKRDLSTMFARYINSM